jgi:alkylation response protein AidB-like acyl-CoA dehydrogenase
VSHYKSNSRDIEFNLFEMPNVMNASNGSDFDEETVRTLLKEMVTLSEGPLAESFASGDRNPPVYHPDTYSVTMPEGFKKSYKTLVEGGFWQLEVSEAVGGAGAPAGIRWGMAEMVLGANPALYMYLAGFGFAGIVHDLGNATQKRWAELMVEKQWGATMVLTEPDAGSDVGAGTTKAFQQSDGSWHIEGVKRFITSAEHDMSENIIHLVLARPVGVDGAGGAGTKGLSLFFVPKYHFDSDGTLGARNGAYVTNVEKKMGLKASTTCEVTFGQNGSPAAGWLIGDVHDGIAQMFKIIEYARMMVGTKAMSTLSTGYLNAVEYAKTRLQGADLTQMVNKTAPRVPIIQHPDVRRSLLSQKSHAEGLRALVHLAAKYQTAADEGGGDAALAGEVNDFLLPLVKGYGSEKAYTLLGESLQTLGGSGYLQDYPLEQYIRDAKIDTLYEGTTAIQGLDFFFRKMLRNKFAAAAVIGGLIRTFTAGNPDDLSIQALKTSLGDAEKFTYLLGGWVMESQNTPDSVYRVGLNTTRFLNVYGNVIVGWLLLVQRDIALRKLGNRDTLSGKDVAFYEGKVVTAEWFAENVLPTTGSDYLAAVGTSLTIMSLPVESF